MKGTVKWIGIRPERRAEVQEVTESYAGDKGLTGDHADKEHRQVTLIFQEALDQAARNLGVEVIHPSATRRNVLVSGVGANHDKGSRIRIGNALLEVTGPCLPCSRMDENLGDGGRLALASADAGGVTARILEQGSIAVGDEVEVQA